ncbi:MAG: DUF488 family protein [Acidobacteriota bacterium]
MSAIYAIGHSTRPLDDFVELLKAHGITLLADIRTIPRSRHNPQFNRESLERELPKKGIQYRHLAELGGLRHSSRDSINLGWQNSSFRGYADYMQTRAFASAIRRLMELAKGERVAIMCAEGNPFRCHRLLVADALTVRGVHVLHISSRKSAKEHRLTSFAHAEGTRITYPSSSVVSG